MIGITSDTHENEEAIKKAVTIFKKRNVEFVVHCGDIISPPMLEYFKGLNAKFVLGNNDGEIAGLNIKSKQLGFEPVTDEKEFVHEGKSFYVYHGTISGKLNEKISSQKYDYILTGHTHLKRDDRSGKTRIINPGALFMVKKHTIALLDPLKDMLEFVEIK